MFTLIEKYLPKEAKQQEVIDFVTKLAKEYTFTNENVLMAQILRPTKSDGYVTSYVIFKDEESFKNFTTSEAFKNLLQSGIIKRAQALCDDIQADTYEVTQSHHA